MSREFGSVEFLDFSDSFQYRVVGVGLKGFLCLLVFVPECGKTGGFVLFQSETFWSKVFVCFFFRCLSFHAVTIPLFQVLSTDLFKKTGLVRLCCAVRMPT